MDSRIANLKAYVNNIDNLLINWEPCFSSPLLKHILEAEKVIANLSIDTLLNESEISSDDDDSEGEMSPVEEITLDVTTKNRKYKTLTINIKNKKDDI